MVPPLPTLLTPAQTALLIMECQRGILDPAGDRFRQLADTVARNGTLGEIRRLVDAARRSHVPVVFLTASRRSDRLGSSVNCPLLAATGDHAPMSVGSEGHAMMPGLEPTEEDFVVNRMHGISPFHGTELDPLLRNLGVRTVVAAGVSVNVGILGLVIEAVNCGYYVVLPRQAVAGVPESYVEQVFQYTFRWLATITTVDEVIVTWLQETT
ncbi:Isochorismatase family protein YecD [bacterium HR30]|nr:Isochorismatase family protein YecD [bacterium HR30]